MASSAAENSWEKEGASLIRLIEDDLLIPSGVIRAA
jgi:hypothetical protein